MREGGRNKLGVVWLNNTNKGIRKYEIIDPCFAIYTEIYCVVSQFWRGARRRKDESAAAAVGIEVDEYEHKHGVKAERDESAAADGQLVAVVYK